MLYLRNRDHRHIRLGMPIGPDLHQHALLLEWLPELRILWRSLRNILPGKHLVLHRGNVDDLELTLVIGESGPQKIRAARPAALRNQSDPDARGPLPIAVPGQAFQLTAI